MFAITKIVDKRQQDRGAIDIEAMYFAEARDQLRKVCPRGDLVIHLRVENGFHFQSVPEFAADYPEVAATLAHTRLPFYCCNCQRKRETTYITPDLGPFCRDCLKEMDL